MAKWVTDAVKTLAQEDPGKTVDDYLVRTERIKTPQEWNTAKTSVRRALGEGGALHAMVLDGTICATAQEKSRVRPGSWVEKARVADPVEQKILRTAGSTRMLTTVGNVNGGVSAETRGHLQAIADIASRSITERKFEIIAEHIDGIVEREAIARLKLEHEKEKAEMREDLIVQLRHDFDLLAEIMRAQGNDIVPRRQTGPEDAG